MTQQVIPPPPINRQAEEWIWTEWYRIVHTALNDLVTNVVSWASLNFSGSNITDISTRNHNDLQSFQGGSVGSYYHLTSTQHTTLTGLPTISSGTYTPTLVGTNTNIDAYTFYTTRYIQVGSVVTVSGQIDLDPTATGACLLKMTLPVASNFGNTYEASGTINFTSVAGQNGIVRANISNDCAVVEFTATNTTNQVAFFNYTYSVI